MSLRTSLNLSGGGKLGLPRLKSNTFSAPCSAFRRAPSSNIFLIQDDLLMNASIFFATVIRSAPSLDIVHTETWGRTPPRQSYTVRRRGHAPHWKEYDDRLTATGLRKWFPGNYPSAGSTALTSGMACFRVRSIPLRRVIWDMGHPAQAPWSRTVTIPSCTSTNSTSPPSACSMGRTLSKTACTFSFIFFSRVHWNDQSE